MATASYIVDLTSPDAAAAGDLVLRDGSAFGFIGAKGLCAEVHLSEIGSAADKLDVAAWESHLPSLGFDPDHQPGVMEYGAMASVYYRNMHDYASAAVYYARALDTAPEPANDDQRNLRRFLTDQLAMSYGISGNIRQSRAVNEAAIARDPGYPLFYYNLACADAEEGKSAAARTHLEQAFARKANTLPGEKLPDPRTDDSILKLKKDQAFWAFVESLPAN
jgi:tetratricopeptide (TPR) repeat protein